MPEPARLTWFKQFRSALEFRGLALRVAVPIVTMIVFGVAVVVMAEANSGAHPGQTPPPSALGFPPATLAGSEFTAAASGRGISQTLGRVASDGAEIVAVGSQDGTRIARAQFFVSADNGATWAMGAVRTRPAARRPAAGPSAGGSVAGALAGGNVAGFNVAGGNGAWVALGPDSIWTSPDGRTWTLASTTGLPLRPGDQISVVKRTAAGFIAAGTNVPNASVPGASTPVVFLSANGITWQRLGAQQLRLAAGTARVEGISYAAAFGGRILIAGDVSMTTGPPGHTRTVPASAAWLSTDGGTTWALAVPPTATPVGPGAQPLISGEAVTGDGFVLFRPATAAVKPASKTPSKADGKTGSKTGSKAASKTGSKAASQTATEPAVDVYRSPDGTAWTYAATLTTPRLHPGMVNGSPSGAVVVGQSGQVLTAFTSANGASWRQDPASAPPRPKTSPAWRSPATAPRSGRHQGRRPGQPPAPAHLAEPERDPRPGRHDQDPRRRPRRTGRQRRRPGNGTQVAVGSANGYLAGLDLRRRRQFVAARVGQTPAVRDRPGIQQLTSVTHGPAGWLAWATSSPWPPNTRWSSPPTARSGPPPTARPPSPGRACTPSKRSPGPAATSSSATRSPGAVRSRPPGGRRACPAGSGRATRRPARWTAPGRQPADAGRHRPPAGVRRGGHGRGRPLGLDLSRRPGLDRGEPAAARGATRTVLNHVASRGQLVVAAGTATTSAGQQVPFAVRSDDGGVTWTESTLPVPGGQASVTALTAAGNEFVATGTFGATPGHQDVVVWTSASGSAWTSATPGGRGLTGPGIQAITALTSSADTVTGVGFSASPVGEEPVFWQSPIR